LAGLFLGEKLVTFIAKPYEKPSLTYSEQIAHLEKQGMIIGDLATAEYWLQYVSYYRLSAYWLYFEHPKNKNGSRFKCGTTFDNVTALYDFDRGLRRLVMRGTEHVEVALRASWAYQMAQIDNGHSYLEAKHYSDRKALHACLSKLAADVGTSTETYMKHYLKTYNAPTLPPVWMAAEMMTFGQVSRWYSNLDERALRNNISEPLGLTETVLVPLIKHLTDVRNICAHHGRLWNRGFLKPPKIAQKPQDLQKSLDQTATQAPAKLYNSLTMIAHIVKTVAPESTWVIELKAHLITHPTNDLGAMGFPDGWQNRQTWS
jgi:abortive infection bacteriophage resistance protein